jgi:hypothetical protein
MELTKRIAALVGVVAMLLTPTAAFATGPEYAPAPVKPTKPAKTMPGPKASLPEKTKAYGSYCRAFSKKRAKGQKETPFGQCLTAMAKAATSPKQAAKVACTGFSKAHVKGQAGTPFSQCVVAAAKVKKEVASA